MSPFLERLSKEGVEAIAADPTRASASSSALGQTTELTLLHQPSSQAGPQRERAETEPFLFRMRAPSSSHCHPVWWWSRAREVRSRAGRFTIKRTGIYPPAFAAVQNPHSHWVFWGPGSWQNLALPGICTTASVIVEVIHASEEVIRYHVYTYICLHVQTYIYAHTHHSFHIYMHTIE